jgi:rfaE bifunctional protein kinase chain/domain
MEKFKDLFEQFSSLRIGVVGDVMLDTYMWGHVERISPEAPVPIVAMEKKEYRIGGAGNVALNIQSLGATPFVLSVTGDDEDARMLIRLFDEHHINTRYCIKSTDRITTNKTRVISRNQQMMRLDAEITRDLCREDEVKLVELFEVFVRDQKPHVVILEDYNKGVLSEAVIKVILSICKKEGIITAVDPKRKNFFDYKGVTIFKPNLREAKEALNFLFTDVNFELLKDIHAELSHLLHHKISFITLSEKGVFYSDEVSSEIIPSHIRAVADVSGAGDTVIAVAALVYAATNNVRLMAEVANIAGGLVCEEVGTVAINKDRLMHECELLLSN